MKTVERIVESPSPAAWTPVWPNWAGAIASCSFAALILLRISQLSILLLPTVALDVLIAISFLRRGAPKLRRITWHARCLAYFASYSFVAFTIGAAIWRRDWIAVTTVTSLSAIGAFLWLFGAFFGLWAVWCLRRSFSIEPQARELVVNGPYTFARHPIYLSYILQYAGIVLAHLTLPYVCFFGIWNVMIFFRARFEEQVLAASFADYATYCDRVWMFGPNLLYREAPKVCAD